jgi:hypothetical protein
MGLALAIERQDRGAIDPFLCCCSLARRPVDTVFFDLLMGAHAREI